MIEKIPQYLFIIAWLSLVLIGIINPKLLIKSLPTQSRIMGIDPSNPSKGALIFLRIMSIIVFIFVLIFVLFMFIGVSTGKLKANWN